MIDGVAATFLSRALKAANLVHQALVARQRDAARIEQRRERIEIELRSRFGGWLEMQPGAADQAFNEANGVMIGVDSVDAIRLAQREQDIVDHYGWIERRLHLAPMRMLSPVLWGIATAKLFTAVDTAGMIDAAAISDARLRQQFYVVADAGFNTFPRDKARDVAAELRKVLGAIGDRVALNGAIDFGLIGWRRRGS